MNEVLIYGDIQAQSAKEFVKEMELAAGNDVTIRVNTPGGEPEFMWGIIAKIQEHQGKKILKLDGMAYSAGTFLPCYADETECLDTTKFLLHRAAYPTWFENNPDWFTEPLKINLDQINKDLEKAFRNKVDVKLFEELTNTKIKDVFSMEGRLDVFFDASVAKKVGLVNAIVKITPAKKAEMDAMFVRAVAKHTGTVTPQKQSENQEINKKTNIMNLEKFKSEHPEIYAAAVQIGVQQERERVKTHLVFHDIDPKGVRAGIEGGKDLSSSEMAEYNRKQAATGLTAKVENDSTKVVKTAEQEQTEKAAKEASFKKNKDEVFDILGLKAE